MRRQPALCAASSCGGSSTILGLLAVTSVAFSARLWRMEDEVATLTRNGLGGEDTFDKYGDQFKNSQEGGAHHDERGNRVPRTAPRPERERVCLESRSDKRAIREATLALQGSCRLADFLRNVDEVTGQELPDPDALGRIFDKALHPTATRAPAWVSREFRFPTQPALCALGMMASANSSGRLEPREICEFGRRWLVLQHASTRRVGVLFVHVSKEHPSVVEFEEELRAAIEGAIGDVRREKAQYEAELRAVRGPIPPD